MPHQTEPSANNALGRLLQRMLPGCEVRTEHTRVIDGKPGLQPDILITAAGRSPVVIEAEYDPAASVEAEAKSRLGLEVAARPIEAAIALRYPAAVGAAADLDAALDAARLSYAVFTQERKESSRFPESGWLDGSTVDLSDLIRLVSVPHGAVDEAATELESGIDRAATILEEAAKLRPATGFAIAGLLGMTNVRQTWRMAGAIIANALIFHERLAGMHPDVKPLELLGGGPSSDLKRETVAAWTNILAINYWPIFGVARDIVSQLESLDAARVLRTLRGTATQIRASGVDNAHDLTGRVFQRLIADRKYLATFYTLPASAALLARLAVAKLEGVDWSDPDAIGKLRVADFACGTGALLSAVYEQIAARHERTGGDAASLHPVMMEEVLYGCDVMPSAIHITGSTLSGIEPAVGFWNSRLYTLAYGRQDDGSVAIGSLELLQSPEALTLFNTSDPARRTGSAGEETAAQIAAEVPHESFDLVIMNPPFTKNTNKEGAYAGTFAGAFAAFNSSKADQRDMSKRMSVLRRHTCYHGHAGMGSAFAALANLKLKPGGILALVLPMSAASGYSWQRFRQMLATGYSEQLVLSIAAHGDDMSFSADTGMADCLIIARKNNIDSKHHGHSRFISLLRRPQSFAQASVIARDASNLDDLRQIEDGPYGGTPIMIGNQLVGECIEVSGEANGDTWGAVRLLDYSLAQTAFALGQSNLWLPGNENPAPLSVSLLSDLGELGYHHLDITGLPSTGPPQGPFSKTAYSPTATYPCLWNHNARNETRMLCTPDSQLEVRRGMEAKAALVWSTAGRSHLNLEFTFGSQPLAVSFTVQDTMGGRVWPNVNFQDKRADYAFAIWGNCTLGLLSYWWHATRQQSSKANITIRSAESLPVLDFRTFSGEQLTTAAAIFEEFRDKEFKPAYLADADPNRALLDRYVICDLLGFDQTIYEGVRRLSAKWCAEPSVHGGKSRPSGSDLIF